MTGVVVHRVAFARGVDPGVIVIHNEDGAERRFVVDETRRMLAEEDDEIVVKLLGHYESAPSKRVTLLGVGPETSITVEPSPRQLRSVWGSLVNAVIRAVEDWNAVEDNDPPPWRVLGDGADETRAIEIDSPGGRFVIKLADVAAAEETPRAGGEHSN